MFQNAIKLHENGKIDEAENIYRELLKTTPKNPDLLHLLGLIAHHKQAFSSAVDFIGQAVLLKPDFVPYTFSLAYALQEWGKPFEALEYYQKIIKLQPDLLETWNNMGNIYRLNGEPQKAKDCFQKALAISPSSVLALNNLALLYIDSGETKRAKELLYQAINIDENYDEAFFNLANLERNDNNLEEALNLYDQALKINHNFARCFNSKGVALERANRFDEAKEAFSKAVSISPKYADALKNLANVLFLTGEHRTAEETYKKALKIDKKLFDAYVNLGNLLQQQNRLEEALENYRKAIILNPKQPEVCNNLGLAVQDLGDIDEAVGLFCNSLYLKPDLVQTKYNLALALYDMYLKGDKEKAIKIAENWVRNFKNDPIANHSLLSLKGETTSKGAANDYLSQFFDAFASDFENTLDNLKYQTPAIIEDILKELTLNNNLKILDLGCGTGLCGTFLKPYAADLIGIDLSSKMLEEADKKQIYNSLEKQDITTYLEQNKNFDLIIAADVFCYFGSLKDVFKLANDALNQNGYFIFSVEANQTENDYQIYPAGRFKHSLDYIKNTLKESGFSTLAAKEKQIRLEKNESVLGLILTAKKN